MVQLQSSRQVIRGSYWEGSFYALMVGLAESFALFYAVKKQLPLEQLALLSTVPILLGSLTQWFVPMLAARFGVRRTKLGAYLLQVVGLLLLALSTRFQFFFPWLFGALVLYWIGGMASGPLWLEWISTQVPPTLFRSFLSRRNAYVAFCTVATYIATAFFLQAHDHPDAFLLVFSLGLLARILSFVTQLSISGGEALFTRAEGKRAVAPPQAAEQNRAVKRMIVCTTLFKTVVSFSSPFFLPFMVQELDYSLLQYVTLTSAPFLGRFLSLSGWGRASHAFRPFLGVQIASLGIAVVPALWATFSLFPFYLGLEFMSGLLWGGFELCTVLIIQQFWTGTRLKALGVHMSLMSAGSVLGAFCGSRLLDAGLGYEKLFYLSSALRGSAVLIMVLAFWRLPQVRFRLHAYGEYLSTVLSLRPSLSNVGRLIFVRRKAWVRLSRPAP
jgi:MFS family permease